MFTHKLFFNVGQASRLPIFRLSGFLPTTGQAGRLSYFISGQQKSPDSRREGATKRLCSSHFSQADDA
jgi:hypothetical protein